MENKKLSCPAHYNGFNPTHHYFIFPYLFIKNYSELKVERLIRWMMLRIFSNHCLFWKSVFVAVILNYFTFIGILKCQLIHSEANSYFICVITKWIIMFSTKCAFMWTLSFWWLEDPQRANYVDTQISGVYVSIFLSRLSTESSQHLVSELLLRAGLPVVVKSPVSSALGIP